METSQVCHNEGCHGYSLGVSDGTNCQLSWSEPQRCPEYLAASAKQTAADSHQQQKPSRAEELVNAHWNGYVGPLLKSCGVAADLLPMLEFMYKSSGTHFYKHALEDQQELARKAMNRDEPKTTLKTCVTCQSLNCRQRGQEQAGCSFWSATPSPSMPFQPHEDARRTKYDCAHYLRIEDTCDVHGKPFRCTGCDAFTAVRHPTGIAGYGILGAAKDQGKGE